MRVPRPCASPFRTAHRPGSAALVAGVVALVASLAGAAAYAADPQCQQCCADAGAYSCPTRLRVFAEGSEASAEGSGWRLRGLWVLDCDTGASFDASATVVLPREPIEGEIVTATRRPTTLRCFQDWCQLPANACLTEQHGGAYALRRCTDGQPMRASELLRRGAPPPAVYVSRAATIDATVDAPDSAPTAGPPSARASGPRPAVGPTSTAASNAARVHAEPEAVFVTRTVVVSGGRTEIHETTTSATTGTTTTRILPAEPQPTASARSSLASAADTTSAAAPTTTAPTTTDYPRPSVPATTPALRILSEEGADPVSIPAPTPRPNPSTAPPPAPVVPATAPPTPSPDRTVERDATSHEATTAGSHADIRVQEAEVALVEAPEYPPHLPAAGPLDITLDFDLPPAPGRRCHTSAAVAAEATRRLDLGDEARVRGDDQTAVDEYRAAVTLDRCNALAWASLGQLAMQADDLDRALHALENAVQLRPEHYGARTNLGLTLEALGRCAEAVEAWRQVLTLRPGHPPAVAGLARCGATP